MLPLKIEKRITRRCTKMRHTVHLENLPFSLKDTTNNAAKHLQTWIFHTMGFKGQHFFFAVLACRSLRCSRFPVFLRSDSHVFFCTALRPTRSSWRRAIPCGKKRKYSSLLGAFSQNQTYKRIVIEYSCACLVQNRKEEFILPIQQTHCFLITSNCLPWDLSR